MSVNADRVGADDQKARLGLFHTNSARSSSVRSCNMAVSFAAGEALAQNSTPLSASSSNERATPPLHDARRAAARRPKASSIGSRIAIGTRRADDAPCASERGRSSTPRCPRRTRDVASCSSPRTPTSGFLRRRATRSTWARRISRCTPTRVRRRASANGGCRSGRGSHCSRESPCVIRRAPSARASTRRADRCSSTAP